MQLLTSRLTIQSCLRGFQIHLQVCEKNNRDTHMAFSKLQLERIEEALERREK